MELRRESMSEFQISIEDSSRIETIQKEGKILMAREAKAHRIISKTLNMQIFSVMEAIIVGAGITVHKETI